MKILLVDDHRSIRRSLRQLLSLRPDFEVAGEGADGREAVDRVESLQPDVVLMDMNMPNMDGVEATRAIKERHPEVQVLALTAFADMSLISSMVEAGASGYLLKGGSSAELFESLEAVSRSQGETEAPPTSTGPPRAVKGELTTTTARELKVAFESIERDIERIRSKRRSPEEARLLDSISDQCERMADLLDQLLVATEEDG